MRGERERRRDGAAPRSVVDLLRGSLATSVQAKLMLAVALAVAVGVAGLTVFFTGLQQRHIVQQNERTMRNLAESVSQSLQTVMLAGYADIAKDFADRLKAIPDVMEFRILRADGTEAFRDNRTIHAVNSRRGDTLFTPRPDAQSVKVLPPGDPRLRAAVDDRRMQTVYEGGDGPGTLTFMAPIIDDEACTACHDPGQPVHGVIKLTTSLEPVHREVRRTWLMAAGVAAGWLVLIMVVTRYLIRRSVVGPLGVVSQAMAQVADGNLNQEVPVLRHDEAGLVARAFNRMTAKLLRVYGGLQEEQNKLTTIILAALEGIVVTDDRMNVVLVNPAAQRLLDKSLADVLRDGFLSLLDDPEQMRGWLDDADDGEPATATVTYKGRILAVSVTTITAPDGTAVGTSALLRDVTEEKRLEEELRRLSITDGLTGLGNRRYLDSELKREVARALRYGTALSVMIFDIDHFKRLNDTYGHDRGDTVLKGVAERLRAVVRVSDIPCRYGGEEFVAIMPSTDAEGALTLGERLRVAIADTPIDGLEVTVTVGVAELGALGLKDGRRLLEAADEALYYGKRAGRNRVILAAAPSEPEAAR